MIRDYIANQSKDNNKKVTTKAVNPCSYYVFAGDPGGIRTPDPRLRRISVNALTMRFYSLTHWMLAYIIAYLRYFFTLVQVYRHTIPQKKLTTTFFCGDFSIYEYLY